MSARLPPPFLAPRLYQQPCPPHVHTTLCSRRRAFHTSPHPRADSTTHYDTLKVSRSASQADIKKQFYHLSKAHHPDLNPDDPEGASQKFVAISEAYAILADPKKREKYDRQTFPASSSSSSSSGFGSYSSAGGAYQPGGRRASGLSKRRGAFRGPPPSFYRSGGFGAQSEKRSTNAAGAGDGQNARTDGSWWQQQQTNSAAHRRGQYASASGGTGNAGESEGWPFTGDPNDVRHFNRGQHFRTQSTVEEQLKQGRKRRRRAWEEEEAEMHMNDGIAGAIGRFVIVGTMLMLGLGTPLMFVWR